MEEQKNFSESERINGAKEKGKVTYVAKGNAKGIILNDDGKWRNPTEVTRKDVKPDLVGCIVEVTYSDKEDSFNDIVVVEFAEKEIKKDVIDVEPKKSFSGVKIEKSVLKDQGPNNLPPPQGTAGPGIEKIKTDGIYKEKVPPPIPPPPKETGKLKTLSIHEKLMNIQHSLKVPKSQVNNFAKFNYRSMTDILEAVKPLMNKLDVSLIISDSIKEIGGRVYVCATATLTDNILLHSVCAVGYARESESKKGMDDAQVTGSTSSYARKYALNGLFAIDDTKDIDSQDNSGGN